jgi:hypothetical protein
MTTSTIRFMILMQWGRVGSNLIVNIINQSKEATLANERFNSVREPEAQLAWYREHFQLDATAPSHRLIGSKENILAVADRDAFLARLRADGVRIIRMRRDNLVKAAVSQVRAERYAEQTRAETGKAMWAIRRGETPLGPTEINPTDLLWRIEAMERARTALMHAFGPDEVLDLEYEQINGDLPDVVARVRAHLDLPDGKPFRVPFIKATPDDLAEVVSNYAAVQRSLQGTRYEAMIPEADRTN